MSVALARNVAGSRSTCDDGVSDVRTGQTNASATAMKLCRYWAVSRSRAELTRTWSGRSCQSCSPWTGISVIRRWIGRAVRAWARSMSLNKFCLEQPAAPLQIGFFRGRDRGVATAYERLLIDGRWPGLRTGYLKVLGGPDEPRVLRVHSMPVRPRHDSVGRMGVFQVPR